MPRTSATLTAVNVVAMRPVERIVARFSPVATTMVTSGRTFSVHAGIAPPRRSFRKVANRIATAATDAPSATL